MEIWQIFLIVGIIIFILFFIISQLLSRKIKRINKRIIELKKIDEELEKNLRELYNKKKGS